MKFFAIFALVISPLALVAQISKNVDKQLPDSLRPVDIHNLSYIEAKKILTYSGFLKLATREDYIEIERLCKRFTRLSKNLKTDEEKAKHALVLTRYWSNRYASREINTKSNILDSALKYVEIYRKYIKNGSSRYDENLATYYALKGVLYTTAQRYPEAYNNIQSSIEIYKKTGDSIRLCFSYGVLSYMHNYLALYPQTIAYSDSALKYAFNKNKGNSTSIQSITVAKILVYKAYAFCNLYAAGGQRQYSDSVMSNVNRLLTTSNLSKYRSTAFDILARLNYHQKNYIRSIAFADSSIAQTPGQALNEDQINSDIFKALSLIRLGKKNEGLALIKQHRIQGTGPEKGDILTELYKSEKEKGNLAKAIKYLEDFQKFQDSSKTLKAKGQIFEIQQKYDVSARDFEIHHLKEEEIHNKMIIAGIGFALGLVGLIFGFRYQNNKKKTQILVNQLDELTQLQIHRIEEEKEKERKRIGQELHDGLSATIAAGIRFIRMMAEDEPKQGNRAHLLEISDMLERDYNKARGKSHELYLEENDENFWIGLESNINLFFAGISIDVSLNRETSGLILTPEEKTAILLVIRESITNVIRHSKATKVEILIYTEIQKLVLEVNDNGVGMPVRAVSRNVGLRSSNERIQNLNGTMTVQPGYPHGTNIRVEIPATDQLFAYYG